MDLERNAAFDSGKVEWRAEELCVAVQRACTPDIVGGPWSHDLGWDVFWVSALYERVNWAYRGDRNELSLWDVQVAIGLRVLRVLFLRRLSGAEIPLRAVRGRLVDSVYGQPSWTLGLGIKFFPFCDEEMLATPNVMQ